jgi:hypothetical protein
LFSGFRPEKSGIAVELIQLYLGLKLAEGWDIGVEDSNAVPSGL